MAPEHLRGYGALSDDATSDLRGLWTELESLIDALERNLVLGSPLISSPRPTSKRYLRLLPALERVRASSSTLAGMAVASDPPFPSRNALKAR